MIVLNHPCKLSPMECCLQHAMGLRRPKSQPPEVIARSLRRMAKGAFGREDELLKMKMM